MADLGERVVAETDEEAPISTSTSSASLSNNIVLANNDNNELIDGIILQKRESAFRGALEVFVFSMSDNICDVIHYLEKLRPALIKLISQLITIHRGVKG